MAPIQTEPRSVLVGPKGRTYEANLLVSRDAKVMFISRGHGCGHAVPDIAIARAVTNRKPDLQFKFVSYAAGAEAFRAHGLEVLDLNQPPKPPLMEMVTCFGRLFAKEKPFLVIAHEEFGVLPAARIFDVPCLFITDFFADPTSLIMWVLRYAVEVLFTAERGLFTEPPYLHDKVKYVGRAVRPFEYGREDRARARIELGIPLEAMVLLCQTGAWGEAQIPLAPILADSWRLLLNSHKHLIWLGGRDYDSLSAKFQDDPTVTILKEDWKIDRLMAASDLLITKANRTTVYEAAGLGLPSIAISDSINWPDDVAVASVESNTLVCRESLTPESLAQLICKKVTSNCPPANKLSLGVEGAADRILFHVERLCQSRCLEAEY